MNISRKLVLYILYFVAVVAVGISIILAFSRHAGDKKPVVKAPTSSQTARADSDNGPVKLGSPAETSQPSSTSATAGASTRTAVNNAAGSSSNARLANTGPGSALAVFMVAAALGFIGYRRLQLNRLR